MSQLVNSIGPEDTSIAVSSGLNNFPSHGLLVASHGGDARFQEIIAFENAEVRNGYGILHGVKRGCHGTPAMAWPAAQDFSVTAIVPEKKLAPWLESILDDES